MRRRRWPWVVAAASIVIFVVSNLAYPDGRVRLVWTTMFASIIAAFVVVGALLCVRVPGNPIGLVVLLGSGAVLATTVALGTFSVVAAQAG